MEKRDPFVHVGLNEAVSVIFPALFTNFFVEIKKANSIGNRVSYRPQLKINK